jgi:thiamine-phosphate pyrophosphorylase
MRPSLDHRFLYAILDAAYLAGRDPALLAAQMVAGGVDLLQVRAKDAPDAAILAMARAALAACRPAGVPVIVNDRPDLAAAAGADGVHVGQDDLPVAEARRIVGPGRIVGKSTHSFEQAMATQAEDVDYFAVGPLFATPTKPTYVPVGLELVQRVAPFATKPFFCIGGIKNDNAGLVLAAGGRRIVVVSGILQAPDIAAYCRALKALLAACC